METTNPSSPLRDPTWTGTIYENIATASTDSYASTIAHMQNIKNSDLPYNMKRWMNSNKSLRYYLGDATLYAYGGSSIGPGGRRNENAFGSYNIIEPKVNIVTGMQRQHRKSITAQSATIEGNKVATQYSRCFAYNDSNNDLSYKFSRGFEHGVKTGLAIGEVFLNRKNDIWNGDIDLRIWEYNSFIFDYTCRDIWNFTDCKYIWFQYYSDKGTAMRDYPNHAREISSMQPSYQGTETFTFMPEQNKQKQKDVLIISRFWERIPVRSKFWINLKDKKTYWKPPQELGNFQEGETTRMMWRKSIVINKIVVQQDEPEDYLEEAPFLAFTWDYSPETQQYDLAVRGLPHGMQDAQLLINRQMTINHNTLESSKNSGIIFRQNSIVDVETLKKSGEGIIMAINEGADFPQQLSPVVIPQSNFELISRNLEFANLAANVPDVLNGVSTDSSSGLMEMIRQDAASMGLTKYLDDADQTLKRLGKLQMMFMCKEWDPHKFSFILQSQPADVMEMYNIQLKDYNIVVAEGMYTDVQKRSEFVTAAQVCAMLSIKPPSKYMLAKAPMQGTDELIAAMQEEEDSQKESQAQQLSIELAVKEAQIKKLQAETLEQLNLAKSHYARAGSYRGLEHERDAEVAKNISVANKNNADSIETIKPLIDQYGIDKVISLMKLINSTSKQNVGLEGVLDGQKHDEETIPMDVGS